MRQTPSPDDSSLPSRARARSAAASPALGDRGPLDGRTGPYLLRAAAAPAASTILHALSDVVITTDRAGRVNYVNPAAERASGRSLSEVVGASLSCLLRQDARRSRRLDDRSGDGDQPGLYLLIDRAGTPRPVETSQAVIADERGVAIGRVFVCRDIGPALALSQSMSYGALHDPLTGLANRRGLLLRLDEALAAAGRAKAPLAVGFLDVDGMKAVNDREGHDAGDQVLQSTASRLSTSVRASDTVARIGGDEFVVVLHRLGHANDAVAVTESLTRRLARPHVVGGRPLHITASLGWAFFPRDGHGSHELLRAADRAMYAAKRARAVATDGP